MGNRVILVDDDKLVRAGIGAIVEREGEFKVVAEADSGAEAMRILKGIGVDLVVIDLALPDVNGIELTKEVLREEINVKVVILSMYEDEDTVLNALRSGARGFVLKKASSSDLIDALRAVARGGSYFSSHVSDHIVSRIQRGNVEAGERQPIWSRLTARELEILRLITTGKSSKQIATFLNLGVETVRNYRKTMMRKLGVNNVANLIQIAVRQGLTTWKKDPPRNAS